MVFDLPADRIHPTASRTIPIQVIAAVMFGAASTLCSTSDAPPNLATFLGLLVFPAAPVVLRSPFHAGTARTRAELVAFAGILISPIGPHVCGTALSLSPAASTSPDAITTIVGMVFPYAPVVAEEATT